MIAEPVKDRLARAFDALTEGVVVHGPDGEISSCNQAAERILGAPAAELHGATSLDPRWRHVHADGSPQTPDEHPVMVALRTGEPQLGVVVGHHKPDGSLAWILVNAIPFPDVVAGDGGPAVIASLVDVTAQRQLEADLAASEQLYRATAEHAPHGIALVDLDGRWILVNPALCSITGYTEAELLEQGPVALTHPDDRAADLRRFGEMLAGKSDSCTLEKRYLHRDGSIGWVRVSACLVRDQSGEPLYFVGHTTEITEERADREQRAAQAREQEALRVLATLIAGESPSEVIFGAAAEQAATVLLADHGGVVQIGPSGDAELVGSWSAPGFPIVPTGTIMGGRPASAVSQALRTGQITNLERYPPSRKNAEIPTESALVAPFEVNGRLWGAVTVGWGREAGASHDATARIARIADLVSLSVAASEARRRQARDAHASRIESLGQLAGGVAHDFNNLISVILNYSHFVAEAMPADSPAVADLQEIIKAAERAGELTRQLLTFGRRQITEREPITLNDVVTDLEGMLRRTLGEHVRVRTVLDPELATTLANRSELEQVLVNLAINSRDAMPGGGELTITTRNESVGPELAAQYPGAKPGSYVRLDVSDDGTGMSPFVRERAFEPFFTTKVAGEGTGIGLATVHGIVTQSHGIISLSSEVGVGTTCTIRLPSCSAPELAAPTMMEPSPGVGRAGRLLIVDDEEALRHVTARMLTAAGYEVTEATSPVEALALIEHQKYDLLLSDVVMPEMHGTELAARAKASDAELRVILMSGYVDPAAAKGAEQPPQLLIKPFTHEELLDAIAGTLATAHR